MSLPHSRHIDVMQKAYQSQVTPDRLAAYSVTRQQPPAQREALSSVTNDIATPPATNGTFSRCSTYRPEAQVSSAQEPMVLSITTQSSSRPHPRHQKSNVAPNVRPRPANQGPSSSASDLAVGSPLTSSPIPLIRRKTVTHKQSDTGLVLNTTPAPEPLPPWSPYTRSNPDADMPTTRARNSTLRDYKRSLRARAVAAGIGPPSLFVGNELSAAITSPETPMAKEQCGLFRKSKSFGMLRRSTVSNEPQLMVSALPLPPMPMSPSHTLPVSTSSSRMSMPHNIDLCSTRQHYLNDITTQARHRLHLDLSISPPPLISPSSSDIWSPSSASASPSSPKPAVLSQQTYFLSPPPVPARESFKRIQPSSHPHDGYIHFTPSSMDTINIDLPDDSASSPRTTTPDVDSRSFDPRMLYDASPSASLASVASTPRSRGRTNSHSASGQLRSPRQQKLPGRLNMPLPAMPYSPPTCPPPSRPIPPVPVTPTAASYTSRSLAVSFTSTPTPAPATISATASASFPAPSSPTTTHTHALQRAASETPAPESTLQSFWDSDGDSSIDKPKPWLSSMPIWRKVKAGLHLAKRNWEKGISASGSGNGSGSVSAQESGRECVEKRVGKEEADRGSFEVRMILELEEAGVGGGRQA